MVERHYSSIAITSFALGIITFIWLFLFVNLDWIKSYFTFIVLCVLLISSILFGFIGLNRIKKNKGLKGKLFAWLGIILSFLSLLYSIFVSI